MFAEAAKPGAHFRALPVLLGLAPTLLSTGFVWLQGNSKTKRRSQLAERLVGLAKAYSEQGPAADEVLLGARTTLGAEIGAVCAELASLQSESQRTSRRTSYGWISDTLLLFRPHGLRAWLVHFVFYSGTGTILLGLIGVVVDPHGDETKSALLGFSLIGLILLGLQRLALSWHKQDQSRKGLIA